MTVEEIFAKLATHMAKGLMIHDQISHIYGFLNLCGYQKCHEYHFYEESKNYQCLHNYYVKHFYKLIPTSNLETPDFIPSSWYKHISPEVDTSTKRSMVKELMGKWVDWEKDTKKELEQYYKELYDMSETCAALKIAEFLKAVDKELKMAHKKYINLETIGYDINTIVKEQDNLYKRYCDKIKHIYKD